MPTILPLDPSFRLPSYSLTLLSALAIRFLLHPAPQSRAVLIRTISTLVLPTLTFSILQHRHITLHRTLALRISSPLPSYRAAISGKTVLAGTGMQTIFGMLFSTGLLSNLPLLYSRLLPGEAMSESTGKLASGVGWFFAAVNLTVVVVCWIMIITQEEVKVHFEDAVRDDQVALNKLEGKKMGEGWRKIASTSRRHDVWVKKVLLPNGDHVGLWEMTTRLADNHPLYNPDAAHKNSSPTLRISLP